MNEIGRLFKKTKTIIISRGVNGFLVAGKNYLCKNFSFLTRNVQKTGDILFIGEYDVKMSELADGGYICKKINIDKFNEKYIDLYDIFCFDDDVEISDKLAWLIKKYNKLIIYKLDLKSENIVEYVKRKRKKKIIYISPSTDISGGVMVITEHLQQLQKIGFNVSLISQNIDIDISWKKDFDVPILYIGEMRDDMVGVDCAVATFWDTVDFVQNINADNKYYLVQNKEHLFYEKNNPFFKKAKDTYKNSDLKFLTISRWCQKWLKKEFDKSAEYIPNCIDMELFNENIKPLNEKGKKTRILIEGNPENKYKNVDEAFEIVNKLDENKFEIWFVSYGGKAKRWYKYDKFFQKVPYCKMSAIYKSCDILLKTSKLESFSYPPLEMMACGGMCVVAENEGNSEYVKDKFNVLTYKIGDINQAVENINAIINNSELRDKLLESGFDTVKHRSLEKLNWELKSIF